MLKKQTKKTQPKLLVRFAVYFLLALYFAGTSQFEILHAIVHKHESQVAHKIGLEMDPCDRMMYHHEVENGCDHDSHVVISDECQMCDLVCHGDQTTFADLEFSLTIFPVQNFNNYENNLDSYWAVISSSRAPPSIG